MKRYKQKIFILILITFLSGILLLMRRDNTPAEPDYGSFTPDKSYSWDNTYYAVQEVERDTENEVNMIKVCIYETASDRLVFSFYPARARDFWGICWENDTYNIWTQSADVGIDCYRCDNAQWLLDEAAQRPDYIISKYDD
ncbi:MAG: hypothetical protein NC337_08195 [Roseburia sp.]|nr:hypothetical protein [Roseburia sp.]